jgi:menaquinone-specific isochorismate synthase
MMYDSLDLNRIKDNLNKQLFENRQCLNSGHQFIRLETECNPVHIAAWLASQKGHSLLYWSDRKRDLEIGAVGSVESQQFTGESDHADLFKTMNDNLSHAPEGIRYFGGFSFDVSRTIDQKWADFGNYLFVIPRYELYTSDGQYYFACNLRREEIRNTGYNIELEELSGSSTELTQDIPFLLSRRDHPEKSHWKQMIRQALRDIDKRRYEKIVLARETKLGFERSLNPFQVLNRLQTINPDSIHFCVQPNDQTAFLGGTPELLYARHLNYIYSEAIAGTRRRGKDESEDEYLESELLRSSKDRKEHWFVIETIRNILHDLCNSVENGEPVTILKLAELQHLITNIRGILKADVGDQQILSLIHPTPAVGGYPTESALMSITELEPFRRGWYAAPVGWISKNSAQFAVAIRSGLLRRNNLYLYSGAGIVTGSDPQLEWEEIDTKISNFLHALDINGQIKERYQELTAAQ